MKFYLFGGPADGANVIVDKSREGMQTFPFIDRDGATVLYYRTNRTCDHGHETEVLFVHPSLQDKLN